MSRHAVLYDRARWRRNRAWLLPPAALCYGFGLVVLALRPQDSSSTAWLITGSVLLATAAAFWARQRFSSLEVRGEDLQVRVVAMRQRIPLRSVRRVRVAPLGSVFTTPQRRRLLPGGGARAAARWLDTDAVVIRIADGVDMQRLRRVVGRRCLVDHDLVVPVDDAPGLAAAIDAARPAPVAASAARRRKRR